MFAHRFLKPTLPYLLVFATGLSLLSPYCTAAQPSETETAPPPVTENPAAATEEKAPAPKPTAKLPWDGKEKESAAAALLPVKSARDILARYNITESELTKFFKGEPIDADEEGVMLKILYHIPGFGLQWIESWRVKDASLDDLALHSKEHQLDVIPLKGRVKHVTKKSVVKELIEQYEFDHYYVAEVAINDSGYLAEVFARKIPASWKLDTEMNEPVEVDGLFIKVGGAQDEVDEPRLIFAAGRIRWYPDQESKELALGPDQLRLTSHGIDWGQFEDVKKTNRLGIGEVDRESFYQLLTAVKLDAGKTFSARPETELSVEPLLNNPQAIQGNIFPFKGIVRRITKVLVEDADIQERFHLDHYYQLDCFLPLGQKHLRLGESPEQSVEYNNGFPATLCVLELPPDLSPSENIRQELSVDAVFFKTWSFRSEFTARLNVPQPAPMFVAFRPNTFVPDKAVTRPGDTIIGIAIAVTCLLGIGLYFWSTKQTKSQSAFRDSKPSSDHPDFSNLS